MQVSSSRTTRLVHRAGLGAALSMLPMLLIGCSSSQIDVIEPASGLGCVDDSKHCVDQRQAALQSLLADRSKSWIKTPASPRAYASGVRMFAYKQKKLELTCDELGAGRREADAAPQSLRSASGQGLSPAQISRGTMFAAEVGRELTFEMRRRCKA